MKIKLLYGIFVLSLLILAGCSQGDYNNEVSLTGKLTPGTLDCGCYILKTSTDQGIKEYIIKYDKNFDRSDIESTFEYQRSLGYAFEYNAFVEGDFMLDEGTGDSDSVSEIWIWAKSIKPVKYIL